jgi:[ribosomal protein S5]-alanine N-acetyltransferase
VSPRAALQPTLTTARLVLRPLDAADAATIERLAGMFEVAGTTVNIPHPYPPGGAVTFIAAQTAAWRDDSGVTWAVTRDGALIGLIGINSSSRAHGRVEIGYWIAYAEWGRGYATEAARAVVDFAFADGFHRVQATHLVRNPASGRVMQKLGMQYEGRLRAFYRRFDRWEDVEMYAILAGG